MTVSQSAESHEQTIKHAISRCTGRSKHSHYTSANSVPTS